MAMFGMAGQYNNIEEVNEMEKVLLITIFFLLSQEETKQWDSSRGTPRRSIFGKGIAGSGKRKIRLRTINGNIYLKKSE